MHSHDIAPHPVNMKHYLTSFLFAVSPCSALAFAAPAKRRQTWKGIGLAARANAGGGASDRANRRAFLHTIATIPLVAFTAIAEPAIARDSSIVGASKILYGDESIMATKAHGTSEQPVQSNLKYGCDVQLADRICNYNRHFAERAGYFKTTNWADAVLQARGEPVTFYDSVTGKPLFVAPRHRSAQDLIDESKLHGWPSFRDDEVVWDNVRVLRQSGETVSVDGTHLGHNLPDQKGNRYCINLVSIAGQPVQHA